MQTDLEKWKEVRRVACKREDRFRRNTIAFWLSDEEKSQVEAKIILSGVSKGEYYRKAVLGQEVTVIAGNYMSIRVAKVLEQILVHLQNGNTEEEGLLLELVKQLLEVNKNAPAGNRDGSRISEEIQYFGKDIVSSSEQLHNQNVCVAVIFILKITYFIKPR